MNLFAGNVTRTGRTFIVFTKEKWLPLRLLIEWSLVRVQLREPIFLNIVSGLERRARRAFCQPFCHVGVEMAAKRPGPEGEKGLAYDWRDLPFVVRRDRHPRIDWCYREKGRRSVKFVAAPGTQAFLDEYWTIRCDGLSSEESQRLKDNPRIGVGVGGVPGQDLTGLRFGRLAVLRRDGVTGKRRLPAWLCRCDCGAEKTICGNRLQSKSSPTLHCGCLWRQNIASAVRTHGLSKTRLAKTLWGIKDRIDNPNCPNFKNYGGRGIQLCDRWRHGDGNLSAVECFIADMGPRPAGMSIDRIDNNGNYEPSNCRWATVIEQHRNTRSTVFIELNGETKCLAEWAEIVGISKTSLTYRLSVWPVERALSSPRRNWSPPKKAA